MITSWRGGGGGPSILMPIEMSARAGEAVAAGGENPARERRPRPAPRRIEALGARSKWFRVCFIERLRPPSRPIGPRKTHMLGVDPSLRPCGVNQIDPSRLQSFPVL